MGITPRCVLNAIEGEESATVVNDRKVSFRDQTMSLTCATRVCRDFSYNVNPYPYWLYSGCRLSDKYEDNLSLGRSASSDILIGCQQCDEIWQRNLIKKRSIDDILLFV